jgi:hypothetical protein
VSLNITRRLNVELEGCSAAQGSAADVRQLHEEVVCAGL